MATPLNASLPGNLDLGPGFTFRVTALAVSDGSTVTAVKVSNFGVLVGDQGGTVDIQLLQTAPYMLVPGPSA